MSSTSQNPPDSILLARLGELLMTIVVETCTFTLIYGVFVLLFSQATVAYVKKKHVSQAQYWMFLASTTTFLLATIHEAVLLGSTGILIHSALVGHQDLPLTERLALVDALLNKLNPVIYWIGTFEPILSDSIVVWRLIVLLQHRKWLKLFPLVLLLGSFASLLGFLIFITAGADPSRGFVNSLGAAGDGLSLATNVVATALIGYIYCVHRRDMVAGLERRQPTQAERMLALLVESGIVFCVPQAVQFGLGFIPISRVHGTAAGYAFYVFISAYRGFAVMYPTLVIALVNSHRTFDHMYSTNASLPTISRDADPEHTTTIRFDHPNPSTSVGTLPQAVGKSSDAQAA